MSETKKRSLITIAIVAAVAILILLGVLSITINTFVIDTILHVYLRLLFVPVIIKVLQKCFKDQLTNSMNKTLVLCGVTIVSDVVVVDTLRYVLNGGIYDVVILPVCLPICFMITAYYSAKDTGRDKTAERRMIYILGIPLLLLSLCFEILSFAR